MAANLDQAACVSKAKAETTEQADKAVTATQINATFFMMQASFARDVAAMLSPDVSGKVLAAIEEARSAARTLVKRVAKAGEAGAEKLFPMEVVR